MRFVGLILFGWGIVGATACLSHDRAPAIPFMVYAVMVTAGALVLARQP